MTESVSGQLLAGRYRLLDRIGRGGMGTVWRAEDTLLARQVAVKRLHVPPGLSEEELATLYERTRREASSAARISHPNVVVVHDVVEDEGLPCIVMEYVPSRTLGDLLKSRTLSPEETARIGRGMIAALRAAHAAGVLHRDVKPGNVLLGEDGRVVLTDFGIAYSAGNSTLTKTGEMVGSIDYIAPERVRGAKPSPAADLWALGATLYRALEGRTPFQRDTPVETAYAIAVDPVQPPVNAGPLTRLVETLLAKDPALRPPAELVEQILREPAAEPPTVRMANSATQAPPATGTSAVTGTSVITGPSAVIGTSPVTGTSAPSRTAPTAQLSPAAETSPVGRTLPPAQAAQPEAGAAAAASAGSQPAGPKPGRGRGRTVLWASAAVAGVALLASAAYVLTPGDGQGNGAGPAASAPPATRSTPSSAAPSSPPPVPQGYRLVTEQGMGVAFPVPEGWTRKPVKAGVRYVDPTGLVAVEVDVLDLAGPDHVQHWKDVEEQAKADPDMQQYKRERLQPTLYRGQPAAVWEFSWQGRARRFRAIDLGFGREGGNEYAIYLSAPDARWDRYRPAFDAVRDGLRINSH
ncbi:protein kinase [Streptomyces orinoci]|uniref:non-specific serine/threonine protein kinase n=1 Tax=Streptomyces orinoci TaxID=67339 RepID=A0ABV3JU31_STRON